MGWQVLVAIIACVCLFVAGKILFDMEARERAADHARFCKRLEDACHMEVPRDIAERAQQVMVGLCTPPDRGGALKPTCTKPPKVLHVHASKPVALRCTQCTAPLVGLHCVYCDTDFVVEE